MAICLACTISLLRVLTASESTPNLVHDKDFLARFHAEARIAASLDHPNIVRIYDEGEIHGIHYMAMEFLDGADLESLLRSGKRLKLKDNLRIVVSMAEALNYIHEKGLLHRDVKSSNIFITTSGRSVLTDFGIARANDGPKMTQVGEIFGTPEYMSPEQAQGQMLDNRSDLYSLAVVLYECLTGMVPLKGDSSILTINKVIYSKPEHPSDIDPSVPKKLGDLLLQLLEKSPDKRPASTGKEFISILNRVVEEPMRKTRSIERKRKPIRLILKFPHKRITMPSYSFIIIFLGALMAGLIILSGILLFRRNKAQPTTSQVTNTTSIKNTITAVTNPQTPAQVPHDTIQASYDRGNSSILQFISENVRNMSGRLNIPQGSIIIEYTIDTSGMIRNVSVLKGLTPEIDPKILEIFCRLPGHWNPGSCNNQKISLRNTYTVTFPLN